jgi:phospholipase A2
VSRQALVLRGFGLGLSMRLAPPYRYGRNTSRTRLRRSTRNVQSNRSTPGNSSGSCLENSVDASKKSKKALLKEALMSLVPGKRGISILRAALAVEGAVTKDLLNIDRYPEVAKIAEVRRGIDLCSEEKAFLLARKAAVRDAFAGYLELDPASVHPDDVPVIGFGGSGGGFRAMIGVLGYCEEMKKTSLWDAFTYVAGVSGSCWSLAAYYTFGGASMAKVIDHCKTRLSPHHPLSYKAIREVLSAGPYATLGPLIQKRRSGLETVWMDLYSVLTTGYIFLHDDPAFKLGGPGRDGRKEVAGYHDWYKWSDALLDGGKQPLPILTAVRHERPWTGKGEWLDAWFQWFEMTPFEVGCDELGAWCPTWAFGRPFSAGKSVMQLPEQSLALLLGLCTSAPAAHLRSWIDTMMRNIPKGILKNLVLSLAARVEWFLGKQRLKLFQLHHPIHACNEHNFM